MKHKTIFIIYTRRKKKNDFQYGKTFFMYNCMQREYVHCETNNNIQFRFG